MRKHTPLIGWPRHDPRHHRFPIPNAVWVCKLKSMEFVVLSYLCYRRTHGCNGEVVTAEAVAQTVHITAVTAKKCLAALINKGLVFDEQSLTLTFRCGGSERFFTLPNEIFLLNLPPAAFMVYAYLLLIEDRRTHTCHPSYNTIATETGMAKNTVMKSVGVLLDKELITMEHSRYFDQHGMKWKGNNLYTILPTRSAVDTFHQQQLYRLELDAERRRVRKRQDAYDRRHPKTALHTSTLGTAESGPTAI